MLYNSNRGLAEQLAHRLAGGVGGGSQAYVLKQPLDALAGPGRDGGGGRGGMSFGEEDDAEGCASGSCSADEEGNEGQGANATARRSIQHRQQTPGVQVSPLKENGKKAYLKGTCTCAFVFVEVALKPFAVSA